MSKSVCQRKCSECSMLAFCQGCSICEKPFCKKDCDRCFSLCPDRFASFAHLRNVGGGNISLQTNTPKELPHMIPVIPDRLTEKIKFNVIGIHGANFFTSNGENVARVYRKKGIKDALNIENETDNVLEFYVKDRTLEGFWDNRREVYRQLKEFSWKAIISPNFSVYEDAPRMDHLYNIKRSTIIYNEMLDAGLPAIPDVSWFNVIDLEQWAKEINEKSVKQIAFSFQVVGTGGRAANTYIHYAAGFRYLLEHIPQDIRIILAGVVSPNRLKNIFDGVNCRFSVLNQSAYIHSRRGRLSESNLSPPEMNKNQIFLRNIEFYEKEYRRICNAKEQRK